MFLIQLQEKMNKKFQQMICHANVNVTLMEKNLIQTKSGTSINVDAIVKKIYVKNSI